MKIKKKLSVFGLFTRSTVYKILAVLAAMCITETISFLVQLNKTVKAAAYDISDAFSLERTAAMSGDYLCFGTAFLLITAVLCLPGCSKKSKTEYTLRRLDISEKNILLCHALYNLLVFCLLYAVQTAVCLLLGQIYVMSVPENIAGRQTVFLAFCRNGFWHSVFPAEDLFLWIRNIVFSEAMSLAAADFPYQQRRGKFEPAVIPLAVFINISFSHRTGGNVLNIILIILAVPFIIFLLSKIFGREEKYPDEDE